MTQASRHLTSAPASRETIRTKTKKAEASRRHLPRASNLSKDSPIRSTMKIEGEKSKESS